MTQSKLDLIPYLLNYKGKQFCFHSAQPALILGQLMQMLRASLLYLGDAEKSRLAVLFIFTIARAHFSHAPPCCVEYQFNYKTQIFLEKFD